MQTTSIAASAPAAGAASTGKDVGDESSAQARHAFEGLLTSLAMKPLTEALGPMGAFFGDALARAAVLRDSGEPS